MMIYNNKKVKSFNNILKWKIFPLSDILNDLLKFGKESLGCPVEFEFAVNLYEDLDINISGEFLAIFIDIK